MPTVCLSCGRFENRFRRFVTSRLMNKSDVNKGDRELRFCQIEELWQLWKTKRGNDEKQSCAAREWLLPAAAVHQKCTSVNLNWLFRKRKTRLRKHFCPRRSLFGVSAISRGMLCILFLAETWQKCWSEFSTEWIFATDSLEACEMPKTGPRGVFPGSLLRYSAAAGLKRKWRFEKTLTVVCRCSAPLDPHFNCRTTSASIFSCGSLRVNCRSILVFVPVSCDIDLTYFPSESITCHTYLLLNSNFKPQFPICPFDD